MSWPTIVAKSHVEMAQRQLLAKSGEVVDTPEGEQPRVTNREALELIFYWRGEARRAKYPWPEWSPLARAAVGERVEKPAAQMKAWYPAAKLPALWRDTLALAEQLDARADEGYDKKPRKFRGVKSAHALYTLFVRALIEDARKGGRQPPVVLPPRPRLPSGGTLVVLAIAAYLLTRDRR